MVFARKVWKLLVAIKDGLALLFLLLFFALLYAVLTARPNAGTVRDGALLLKLDGTIVEEPSVPDPVEVLLSKEAPVRQYRTRDVVRALRTAATDKRVKAVVLDLSTFLGSGFVSLQEVGAALDAVRAAKKPVFTYATAYVDDSLLLAAHSSEVWVHPLGGAFVMGPGGGRPYYAALLDKLKVTAHVFRVGTFKSAVEPYMRNDQSPEAREAVLNRDQQLPDLAGKNHGHSLGCVARNYSPPCAPRQSPARCETALQAVRRSFKTPSGFRNKHGARRSQSPLGRHSAAKREGKACAFAAASICRHWRFSSPAGRRRPPRRTALHPRRTKPDPATSSSPRASGRNRSSRFR
jgi:hypothetical protein